MGSLEEVAGGQELLVVILCTHTCRGRVLRCLKFLPIRSEFEYA